MNFEQKENIGFHFVTDLFAPRSGVGKKALRRLAPLASADEIVREYARVSAAVRLVRERQAVVLAVRAELGEVKDVDTTLSRVGEPLTPVELFEIKNFCARAVRVRALLDEAQWSEDGVEIAPLAPAHALLNASGGEGFLLGNEYSARLGEIRAQKKKCTHALVTATQSEREALTREHLALAAAEQDEERAVCARLSRELKPYAEALASSSRALARLDLLLEKASLILEHGATVPTLSRDGGLRLVAARNPLVADALNKRGKVFTPITLELCGTAVITGANMGGKSVALKTVALNAYLWSCAIPVFAERAEMPYLAFVEILSEQLEASDRGLSSFGGEIIALNKLFLLAKEKRGLLLCDEFAGGTNVEEGKRLFIALLKALRKTPSLALLTTHFDGVSEFADKRYQIAGLSQAKKEALKHLSRPDARDLADVMDYGLVEVDRAERIPRDAIDVARLLGLDEGIISLL